MGLMIGLSFFYLLPLSNHQIRVVLNTDHKISNLLEFPYGTLTAILAFVFVLANSNYFYHANSTRKNPQIGNFRTRS